VTDSDSPNAAPTGRVTGKPATTDAAPSQPQAALECLAAEFNPADFAVTLTLDEGCPPRLTVTNRRCPLSETVFADGQFYWFAWAEPVGPVIDPVAAAAKLARVLRAVPEPSHG
jgi:hypothetical protein